MWNEIRTNIDKSTSLTHFTEAKNSSDDFSMPYQHRVKVTEILDYNPNEGIIGRVVKSYAAPKYLTDGKLDWRKVHPILWVTGGDNNFYKLGERIIQNID